MSKLVNEVKQELRRAVLDAAGRCVAEGLLPAEPMADFLIETPQNKEHGDFAVNAAMVNAKTFRLPPRKIAEAIRSRLELSGTMLERCEIAGPGFLNFFLKDSFFSAVVADVLEKGSDYGKSDYGQGQKVMVEFVSANPTGPMHIGNARGGALGDCLASALQYAGYEVSREFYINDAGNQIDKFGVSLEARYLQIYQGEDAVPFPEDGYHGEDIRDRAREFAAIHGDRYVSASGEERRQALVDYALPKNIEGLKTDLAKYKIHYDNWFHESLLHQNGELQETIDILTKNGMTYEKEGALWYKATQQGAEKDEVLIRANGNPTYFAADIAYHRNKILKRGYQLCIDVWGADHHGHVARLKGALDAVGLDGSRLHVVLMQLVRLMRDGEMVKVSKRTGKSITLTNLLEEVPVDAARFLFNLREPNSQFDFDLDLAVAQTSQNPVYYVQYAHARICSIVKALQAQQVTYRLCTPQELALLSAPEERAVISVLSAFTGEIVAAAKDYDPARITRYCIDLATAFHKFYNACRVQNEDETLTMARLNLCMAVRTVIKNALDLLNISAPQSM